MVAHCAELVAKVESIRVRDVARGLSRVGGLAPGACGDACPVTAVTCVRRAGVMREPARL